MSLQLRCASFVEQTGQNVDGSSARSSAADGFSARSGVEIGSALSN
jgi:hypothetical protein